MDVRRLALLYGGEEAAKAQLARFDAMRTRFSQLFASTDGAAFVSAPGRTEIAGNHTDHNNGRVLAAAVNMDTVALARKTGGNIVTLYSEGYDKPFVVDLNTLDAQEDERETTSALIRGAAAVLSHAGYKIGGFDAYVTSTVLRGSGLSSSAAFEVMLVALYDMLFNGWTIPAEDNARMSQKIENEFFGKPCGLMDQMASAVGGLVFIDFDRSQPMTEAISFDFSGAGHDVCVVSAGGEHGNLTAEYASIPAEMKQVASALGAPTLREVEGKIETSIPMLKGAVSDRAILRALHFESEDKRVNDMRMALKAGDLGAFLSGVVESGESSWRLLQNLYVPGGDNQEMPLALELSRRMLKDDGGAWRIHGGGFAGTILAFVPKRLTARYIKTMEAVFGAGSVNTLYIRPEGAVLLGE